MSDVDPIFKGCTRPAMMLGVPLMPLMMAVGGSILLGTYTNPIAMLIMAPAILIMRGIVATDDQRFRSIGLYLKFRFVHFDKNRRAWDASSFSPNKFSNEKRK